MGERGSGQRWTDAGIWRDEPAMRLRERPSGEPVSNLSGSQQSRAERSSKRFRQVNIVQRASQELRPS